MQPSNHSFINNPFSTNTTCSLHSSPGHSGPPTQPPHVSGPAARLQGNFLRAKPIGFCPFYPIPAIPLTSRSLTPLPSPPPYLPSPFPHLPTIAAHSYSAPKPTFQTVSATRNLPSSPSASSSSKAPAKNLEPHQMRQINFAQMGLFHLFLIPDIEKATPLLVAYGKWTRLEPKEKSSLFAEKTFPYFILKLLVLIKKQRLPFCLKSFFETLEGYFSDEFSKKTMTEEMVDFFLHPSSSVSPLLKSVYKTNNPIEGLQKFFIQVFNLRLFSIGRYQSTGLQLPKLRALFEIVEYIEFPSATCFQKKHLESLLEKTELPQEQISEILDELIELILVPLPKRRKK